MRRRRRSYSIQKRNDLFHQKTNIMDNIYLTCCFYRKQWLSNNSYSQGRLCIWNRMVTTSLTCLILLSNIYVQTVNSKSVLQHTHIGNDDDGVVKTSLGLIRGNIMTFDGTPLKAFLGVPYALKPTGVRRFGVPEMVRPWEGEFIAETMARTCYITIDTMFPQFPGAEMWNPSNEVDEDCLTMNIWVPEKHDGTVMVWIYGGGFFSGSPSLDLYDGRVLAVRERVIVVNINYRLGAFGFLYFGAGSPVPGNMGLLDQQMALRWVNENIAYFGGDPRRVTLFGESSGGASASAHLFAQGSKNYFTKLIAKSGSIVNNWATKPKEVILEISLTLAKRLNCTPTIEELALSNPNERGDSSLISVDRIVGCMSRVPAFIVQREANAISEAIALPMTFAFVPIDEDENFFRGNLFDKIRRRDFKKDVSIMLGTVKDEGTYWLPYYLNKFGFGFNHTISAEDRHNQALISELDYIRAFDAFIPYFGGSPLIRHALMHAYARLQPEHDHSKSVERWRDGVARFLGDYFFTCSLIDFADIVADNIFGSVFMYYFTKRSSANPWPKWMGVMHGYEIEYVFGLPLRIPQPYSPSDLKTERIFSEKIMKFWGTFSRTGSPVDFWPKYNRITRKSLVLSEEIAVGNSHRIYVDVHGKFCRLLDEAQNVARNEFKAGFNKLGNVATRAATEDETRIASSMATASGSSSPGVHHYAALFFCFYALRLLWPSAIFISNPTFLHLTK